MGKRFHLHLHYRRWHGVGMIDSGMGSMRLEVSLVIYLDGS